MTNRILFVCTGNTCRSPMAAAWCRSILSQRGLARRIEVESAGTDAYEGAPATRLAVEAMKEKGLDLISHHARRLTPELVAAYDLILTMDQRHLERVSEYGGRSKARLLGSYASPTVSVSDPMCESTPGAYRRCCNDLERLVSALVESLAREA